MEKRLLLSFDWSLIIMVLILGALGVVNIYSASHGLEYGGTPIYIKQIYWLILGFVVMLLVAWIGPYRICSLAYPIFIGAVLSLGAVLLFGRMANNARRWLTLGPLTFQPSEMMRIAIVLLLAYYFTRREQTLQPYTLPQLIIPFIMMAIPCALVFKQPDLGTTILIFLVGMSVILVNGVRLRAIFCLAGLGLGGAAFSWFYLIKAYHRNRILSFLFPDKDPLGSAWNQTQSIIAVGSGQFTGKGFMAGTQGQLNFLPEHHTDFAFSVLAEEWGFVGAALVLFLLASIILRSLLLAYRARDHLGMLVIVGCTSLLFWPTVINVAMVTGIFPVTGMPLPFISYGGSALLTNMAAIGLIQGVVIRRYVFTK
jgi:rod shape determining protein RodA